MTEKEKFTEISRVFHDQSITSEQIASQLEGNLAELKSLLGPEFQPDYSLIDLLKKDAETTSTLYREYKQRAEAIQS